MLNDPWTSLVSKTDRPPALCRFDIMRETLLSERRARLALEFKELQHWKYNQAFALIRCSTAWILDFTANALHRAAQQVRPEHLQDKPAHR